MNNLDKPHKLDLHSASSTQINLDALYQIAPQCFAETRDPNTGAAVRTIDFAALRQMLGDQAIDAPAYEAYQFTWVGKHDARAEAARPTDKTLRPITADSQNWDTTRNLYIEGDNLEVLKILQKSYLGKVKMIYIDPPYNTGNDFVYRDNFAADKSEYLEASGATDSLGNRYIKNTDTNGRYHSDWCSMIYSRLMVARTLLSDDGVIFISIDENEVHNLRKICDELFGAHNFVAELIWSAGRKNDSKYVSVSHEYIVCYFKNIINISDNNITWRERKQGLDEIYAIYNSLKRTYNDDCASIEKELKAWYRNLPNGHPARDHKHYCHVDSSGIFFSSDISWPGGGGPKYEVLHPVTQKPVRVPSRGWITSEENMKEWIKQDKVYFGPDENYVPTVKSYLKDREYSVPYSVFYQDGRAASKRLASLIGEKVFENPKDEEIIQRLIEFCGTKDDDIILDFFSGSATTAHALFLANLNQNMKRRFILVQLPEVIDVSKSVSEKSKRVAQAAIDLLDSIKHPHNLCGIAKERIRRAGAKIKSELDDQISKLLKDITVTQAQLTAEQGKMLNDEVIKTLEEKLAQQESEVQSLQKKHDNLDTGFRVLRLDISNFEDVYLSPKDYKQETLDLFQDNIRKDGRTDFDLLFGCMLSWGVQLSLPMQSEVVEGKTIYTVNEGDLVACFADKVSPAVIEAMADKQPLRVIFRDSCFENDADKINIYETFKQKMDWSDQEVFKNIRVI